MGRGWQDRCVQMQNAWCDTVWHQLSCSRSPVHAASHPSCISHLKVTFYPWKAPKIFSCLKGFKAGFMLALCLNSIRAVTAKAGWCMDSPMASGLPPHFVPVLWVWSFHTNITGITGTKNLVFPENNSNPIYCIALMSIPETARKAGVDKARQEGFLGG